MPDEDAVIRIDADFGPSEDSLRDFVEEAGRMEIELPVAAKPGKAKPAPAAAAVPAPTATPAPRQQSQQQVEQFFKLVTGQTVKRPDQAEPAGADPISEMNRHVRQIARGIEQSLDELRSIGRLLERQHIEKPAAGAAEGVFGGVVAGEVIGGIAAGAVITEGVKDIGGGGLDPVVAGKELAAQVSRNFSDSFDIASLDQFVTGFESALDDMTGAVIEFTDTEIRTTRGLIVALSGATKAFEDVQVAASIPRGGPVPMTGEGELDAELLQGVGVIVGNQVKEAMEPLARAIDQMADSGAVASSMLQQIRALTIQMNDNIREMRQRLVESFAENAARVVASAEDIASRLADIKVEASALQQNMRTGFDALREAIAGVVAKGSEIKGALEQIRISIIQGLSAFDGTIRESANHIADTTSQGMEALRLGRSIDLAPILAVNTEIRAAIVEQSIELGQKVDTQTTLLIREMQSSMTTGVEAVQIISALLEEIRDILKDGGTGGAGVGGPSPTDPMGELLDDTKMRGIAKDIPPPIPSAEDLAELLGPGVSIDVPTPPPPPTEAAPPPAPEEPDEPASDFLRDQALVVGQVLEDMGRALRKDFMEEIQDVGKTVEVFGQLLVTAAANVNSTSEQFFDLFKMLTEIDISALSDLDIGDVSSKVTTALNTLLDNLKNMVSGGDFIRVVPPLSEAEPDEESVADLNTQRDIMRRVDDTLQQMADAIIQMVGGVEMGGDLRQFALDMASASNEMREAAEDFDTAKLKNAFEELARIEIPNEIGETLFDDFRQILERIGTALDVAVPGPTFVEGGQVGQADFKVAEAAADVQRVQDAAMKALEEEGSQISRFAEALGTTLDMLDTRIKETIEDLTTINIDIQPEIAPASDIFESMNEAMELLRTSTLGEAKDFQGLTNAVWRVVNSLGAFGEEVELKQGLPMGMAENLRALGIELERLGIQINNIKHDLFDEVGKLAANMSAELPSQEEAQAFVDKYTPEESEEPGFISDAEATKILRQMLAELQRVVTNLDAFEPTQSEATRLSRAGEPIVDFMDGLKEMKDALHEAAIEIQVVIRSLTADSKKAHDEDTSIQSLEGILARMRELANPERVATEPDVAAASEADVTLFLALNDRLKDIIADLDSVGPAMDDIVEDLSVARDLFLDLSAVIPEELKGVAEELVARLTRAQDALREAAAAQQVGEDNPLFGHGDFSINEIFEDMKQAGQQFRDAFPGLETPAPEGLQGPAAAEDLKIQFDEDAQEAADQEAINFAKVIGEMVAALGPLNTEITAMAGDLQDIQFSEIWDDLENELRDGLDTDEITAIMGKIKDAFFAASDKLENVSEGYNVEQARELPTEFDTIKDAIGVLMSTVKDIGGQTGEFISNELAPHFDALSQAVIAMVTAIGDATDSASVLAHDALEAAQALRAQADDLLGPSEDMKGALSSFEEETGVQADIVQRIPEGVGGEPPAEPPPVAGGAGDFGSDILTVLQEIKELVDNIDTGVSDIESAIGKLDFEPDIQVQAADVHVELGDVGAIELDSSAIVEAVADLDVSLGVMLETLNQIQRQLLNIASDTAMFLRGLEGIENAIDDLELDPTIDVTPDVYVDAQVPDIDVALDMADTNELLSGMRASLDVFADRISELVDRADTAAVFLMDKVDAIGGIAIDIRDLLSSIKDGLAVDMAVEPPSTDGESSGSVADMHSDMLEAVERIVAGLEAIVESADECCKETIAALQSLTLDTGGDSEDVVGAIESLQGTVAEGQSELSESLDNFAAESRRSAAAGRAGGAASTGFMAGLFGGGVVSLLKRFVPILGAGVALKWMFDQLTKSATELSEGFEQQAATLGAVSAPISLGLAELEISKFIAEMQAAHIVQVEFRRSLMESAKMMRSQTTVGAIVTDARREIMEEEWRRLREELTREDITAFKDFSTGIWAGLKKLFESLYNDDVRSIAVAEFRSGLANIWGDLGDRWKLAWNELVEGDLLGAIKQTFLGILQTIGTVATTILGGLGMGLFEILGSIQSFLGLTPDEDDRPLGGRFQAPKPIEQIRYEAAAGRDGGLTDADFIKKHFPLPKAEDFVVEPEKPLDQASMARAVEDGVTRANSKDQPRSFIPPELEEMFRSELASTFSEQLA